MNPAILSPNSRFAVPEHHTGTRSSSRSPDRRRCFVRHGPDPLLSNLSPTSTLQALEAAEDPPSGQDIFPESLAAASASDRAFGIRAALAGKKLKEWHVELSAWPWPEASLSNHNGFRPLAIEGGRRRCTGLGNENRSDDIVPAASIKEHGDMEEGEYCGSLPEKLVREYGDRIEAIRDGMDALELEDLKDFVRDAHVKTNSRFQLRRPGQGIGGTDYNHLDDFTAIVTATIMHALPTIFRLNSLLSAWSTRVQVLRQVPGYLKLLKETQSDMKKGFIDSENAPFLGTGEEHVITEASFSSRRTALEAKIFELGRRLDAMLDLLEGKEDTVPEEWIEEMEVLESDFGGWVIETERRLMEQSLEIHRREGENISRSNELENDDKVSPESDANNHKGLDDDHQRAGGDDGNEIGSQQFHEGILTPFTSAVPLGSDRPGDREEGGLLRPDQEPSLPGADFTPVTALLANDVKLASATGDNSRPKSELDLQSGSDAIPNNQVLEVQEGLRLVRDGMASLVFESSTFPDNLTANEQNKEPSQERAHTPLVRHSSQGANDEITLPHTLEVQSHQITSTEPHPQATANGPKQVPSNYKIEVDKPAPKLTRSLSTPIYCRFGDDPEAQSTEQSMIKTPTTPRPSPLILRHTNLNSDGNAFSEISSDTSRPGSGTSEYFSNLSSPELQQASVAEYFENPVEVTTSLRSPSTPLASISRQSSQRTMRGESLTYDNGPSTLPVRPSNHTRRASSFAPESTIFESSRPGDGSRTRPDYLNSHSRVRSASLRSFEIIPRNEVTTLNEVISKPHC